MNATQGTWSGFGFARIGVGALVGLAGSLLVGACSGSSEDQDPGSDGNSGRGNSGGEGGTAGSTAGTAGSTAGTSPDACIPRSCTATVCGVMQDDGCGNLIECACPDGCVPATCESKGAECGETADGCGNELDCGDCEGEETCGGSGTPNVCGCEPTTCEEAGRECGELSDGCGGTLDCGDCPGTCSCDTNGACQGDSATADSPQSYGRKAESSGFHGTEAQYSELYQIPCFSGDDCVEPCLTRDGTEEMCEAMTCSSTDTCLPTTVWTRLATLAAEGTDCISDCAELVLWSDPYRDYLRVTDFRFEIPESAEILGITVTVRRAGGSSEEAVDAGVHVIKGGVMGSADRSVPTPWSGPDLANVEYGGPTDLWNETFTPADINADDFGVAVATAFTQTAGNGRAYVDIVYATVHYRTTCD